MKKIITSLFCLISFSLFAQDFQLFKSGTNVVFTDSVKGFSVAFDSIKYDNGDSVYYNFKTVRDTLATIDTDTCYFWGPDWALFHDKPTWLGAEISENDNNRYRFITLYQDTLSIDFNLNIGDSTLFYKDDSQFFYLKYTSEQEGIVLNYSDLLRFYEVIHTDASGNTINSDLHGSAVIIGEDLGLVRFFQVDNFPTLLNPVYLLGHSKYDLGLYQITEAGLYDYQIGDEIQYQKYYQNSSGNPELNFYYFEKLRILERVDGADSVHYLAEQIIYTPDSNESIVEQINLEYSKERVLQEVPFEKYDAQWRSLQFQNYNELNLWNYKIEPDLSMRYCAIENCWGTYDAGGPLGDYEHTYIIGVGLDLNNWFVGHQSGSTRGEKIVYFKKNGNVWGKEVVLGVDELELETKIKISPNPVSSQTTIKSSKDLQNALLRLLDISGKVVLQMEDIYGARITLLTEQLSNGFYFLELSENNSVIAMEKLVVKY